MMNSTQRSVALLLSPALIAAACGGTIDLDSPQGPVAGDEAGAGGSAEAGADSMAGKGVRGPAAGASGKPSGGQAGSGAKPEPEGEAGQGGTPALPGEELRAWLAFDAQPDGESRGIYWLSAPQSACQERLTPDGVNAKQPTFSSDGALLAYAAEDDNGVYQIFTRETDGGQVRQITELEQGATYPVFVPGDGALAFVTGDPEAFRDGLVDDTPEMGNVMLATLKSLEVWQLEPRDANQDYPYFAPAFARQDRLLLTNSYVIRELRLTFTGAAPAVVSKRILTSPGVPQEPAPSPDGFTVVYPDTCTDTLRLYQLDITGGSPRSCVPASRDYLLDAGVRSPDWGSFGFIVAEHNAPNAHGLPLYDDRDLSNGGHVATPTRPRNPSWGPEHFTRKCVP